MKKAKNFIPLVIKNNQPIKASLLFKFITNPAKKIKVIRWLNK